MPPYMSLAGTPFVWDDYLRPGMFQQDISGVWHIGRGTDPRILVYQMNLTDADKQFLQSIKINPYE